MFKKKRKKGGKLTDNWIGTNANGDFFHANNSKDREYPITGIADLDPKDLPDFVEGKTSKNRKEKS